MAKTLKLTAGSTTLDLNDMSTGIIVGAVDIGAPAVREVVSDLAGQDGADDQTAYLGQRVVSITGNLVAGVVGSKSKVFSLLAPFLNPKARPVLTYALDDDDVVKTLGLRPSQWTGLQGGASDSHQPFQLQFKGDPVALAQTTNEVDIAPFSNTAGRTYPRAYNLVYPVAVGGTGTGYVNTGGSYPTWPIFRIYGPATNPVVAILDASGNVLGSITFANINVTSGSYLEVNTKARTVLLNGSAGASRYSFLDFSNTQWVPLQPGTNQVRFTASSASSPALLAVLWQDASL